MRVSSSGRVLSVNVSGQGEPVLMIHGAFFARPFEAMASQPALRDNFQLIAPERFGYGASSKPEAPYTLDVVIADLNAVLDAAGTERAHVVAHSAGGAYARQLMLEHPERVHSLTLVEAAIPTPEWAAFLERNLVPAGGHLQNGDPAAALDTAFGPVHGSMAYRTEMDANMPDGWYERALADLPHLFLHESPALRSFSYGPQEAQKITQPVLMLMGEKTESIFVEMIRQEQELLPHAEVREIPGSRHMAPVLHPAETAEALAAFLKAHPMPEPAASS